MVSLVDIVPQTRTVRIAAGDLELRGLGLRQIADLFLQFPNLRNLTTEGAPEIAVAELIIQGPDAIAGIIASAADQPEAAEPIANGILSPDDIVICLTAIRDLTFPRGVRPLLESIEALVGAALSGRARDTNVPPPPSNSLAQDMSPTPS